MKAHTYTHTDKHTRPLSDKWFANIFSTLFFHSLESVLWCANILNLDTVQLSFISFYFTFSLIILCNTYKWQCIYILFIFIYLFISVKAWNYFYLNNINANSSKQLSYFPALLNLWAEFILLWLLKLCMNKYLLLTWASRACHW